MIRKKIVKNGAEGEGRGQRGEERRREKLEFGFRSIPRGESDKTEERRASRMHFLDRF